MRVGDALTGPSTLRGFRAAVDAWADGEGLAAQFLVVEPDDREAFRFEHGGGGRGHMRGAPPSP